MTTPNLFIVLIILLILNSFFAMAEYSIAASRKTKLQSLYEQGDENALKALHILENPSKFITSIQIGLNIIAIISGVIAEDRLSAFYLEIISYALPNLNLPMFSWLVPALSIITIASFFIVLSELIPKKIALSNPERYACIIVTILLFFMKIFSPLEIILTKCATGILSIFGVNTSREDLISVEEVSNIISDSAKKGVLDNSEHNLIQNVLSLTDTNITNAITLSENIRTLDVSDDIDIIKNKLVNFPHSKFIVTNGSQDNILGYIDVKNILTKVLNQSDLIINKDNLRDSGIKPLLILPDTINLLDVLEKFRTSGEDIACVSNEFGMIIGLITLNDIFATLIDKIVTSTNDENLIVSRGNNSWIVDGRASIYDLTTYLNMNDIEPDGKFETVNGFIMYHLKSLPKKGQKFELYGFLFEIIDIDGFKIDDILITKKGKIENVVD